MREKYPKSMRGPGVGTAARSGLNPERLNPLMGLAWKYKRAYEDFACVFIVRPSEGSSIPSLSDVRNFVGDRIHKAPKLMQKLVAPPFCTGAPFWVQDDEFDLSDYIVQAPVEGIVTRDRLDTILGNIMTERIDRTRPLWKMTLIGPLDDGNCCLVAKIDHIIGGGYAGLATILTVLSDFGRRTDEHSDEKRVTQSALDGSTLLRLALRDSFHSSVTRLIQVAGMVRSKEVREELFHLLRMAPAVIRNEFMKTAPKSELNRPISGRYCIRMLKFDLNMLKEIEHSFERHITINDIVLSTLAGGIRSYNNKLGLVNRDLRIKVPVSALSRDDMAELFGERGSRMIIDLPVTRANAVDRLLAINAQTSHAKDQDAMVYAGILAVIDMLPGPLRIRMRYYIDWSNRSYNVSVSNVQGPHSRISILGHEVLDLYGITMLKKDHSVRLVSSSYAGSFYYTFSFDAAAIPDPSPFVEGVEDSIRQLRNEKTA